MIGIRSVNHPSVKVTRSMWRGTNAIESWTWKGCSGNEAQVEVYAQAASVELLLNEENVDRKLSVSVEGGPLLGFGSATP